MSLSAGIVVALVSAVLALFYGYFLQCRLLKYQVKEKNIDSLIQALEQYEKLAIEYWAGNTADHHLVQVRQKVFSDLVYHIGGAYGLEPSLWSCLRNLIMSATGSSFSNSNPKPSDEQQRLVVRHAGELRLVLMRSRYVGWRLNIQGIWAKIKQQENS